MQIKQCGYILCHTIKSYKQILLEIICYSYYSLIMDIKVYDFILYTLIYPFLYYFRT